MPLQFGQLSIQIMRLMMSQEGSSFTSALKGLRKIPSMASSTTKGSRSIDQAIFQKATFSTISSPRVNITTRKDLTLKQLFSEYQSQPHTQYVIRAKKQPLPASNIERFDDWVARIDIHKCTDYQSTSRVSEMESAERNKEQIIREQLKRQISQNLSKMSARLQKKQSQQTKASIGAQLRQFKYSFSEYFSEYSQLQYKDPQRTEQTIKSSRLQMVPATSEVKLVKINPSKVKLPSNNDKENMQPNGSQLSRKIVGLQFSKNKRFKSTKKKRKALP